MSERLRAIRAQRMTIVLDCCRAAGAAEPRDIVAAVLEGSFSAAQLSPLARGTGRAVLAASRADGVAYVRSGERNGVFTRHLLDGLRGAAWIAGDVIRVCDLFDYVQRKVVAEVGGQRPVFKAELEENYPVAHARPVASPPVTPPRNEYGYDGFISYRSDDPEDRRWVEQTLVPRLEAAGVKLFLEWRDASPGRARLRELERAVKESRYTVAVLTPGYLAGPFQEFESVIAQHLAVEMAAPRFVPLIRATCWPPLGIRATAALRASDDREVPAAIDRLAVLLRQVPRSTLGS
jgi:hypothetical protein